MVYMTKMRLTDIIAIEIRVKYCIKAITVSGCERPSATSTAAKATTSTIPPFISRVIMGLTTPIVMPALFSLSTSARLASS